jgi:hypothetical protein
MVELHHKQTGSVRRWLQRLGQATAIGLSVAAFFVAEANAQANFSFDASAGLEQDGRITVDQIDVSLNVGDTVALFKGGVGLNFNAGPNTEFNLGYSGSVREMFNISAFDLQVHGLSAGVKRDLPGPFKLGLDYRFFYTRLGGVDFMKMHRASPFVSYFSGKIYAKISYVFTDKNLDASPTRNTTVNAADGDFMFFYDGVKNFVSASYRYEEHSAVGDPFDFNAHNFSLRTKRSIFLVDRQTELTIGWRYENRNYANITPSIGAIRDDERNRFLIKWEIPIAGRFYGELRLKYNHLTSNLPSANYDETVYGFRIGAEF